MKVVVIPGSVKPVVIPGAFRYRTESGISEGRVTINVVPTTQALPSAPAAYVL